jgi:hypothetical protein
MKILLITPDVDLQIDNGVTLPLRALVDHLPEYAREVWWHRLGTRTVDLLCATNGVGEDGAPAPHTRHLVNSGRSFSIMLAAVSRVRPPSVARRLPMLRVILPLGEMQWDPTTDVVLSYLVHGMELAEAVPSHRTGLIAQDVLSNLTRLRASIAPTRRRSAALSLTARGYLSIERRAYRRASFVSVVSEPEADIAEATIGVRPTVVPNGIKLPPRGDRVDDPRWLLFLGDYGSPRNVLAAREFVSQIAPAVARAAPEIEVHLVGPRLPADLRDIANANGVVVDGYVDDLGDAMSRSVAVVATHPVATGIKNAVLSALGHGVACIVSPVVAAGLPPGLREAVIVVEPGEVPRVVADLRVDSRHREAGSRARRAAESHGDWDVYVRRIMEGLGIAQETN